MQFVVLKPDSVEWSVLFDRMPSDQQDIFYTSAFARLCQETINKQDEVLCAAMVGKNEVILYPFVKRDLARLTGVFSLEGLCDITGLYGRGGIIATPTALQHMSAFHTAMAVYCRENAIVCGFDRFHPVIANDSFAAAETKVMEVGGFVVVDLHPEIGAIERSFKHSVRKNIRKAEGNGITCFVESSCDHLEYFLDIYYDTMGRNSAKEFYYFSKEYFSVLNTVLQGQFHFFYAVAEDEVVSCELVLHHGRYGHSFLGGTKRKAMPLCANPMLKREIISFLKALGCEYFLLGGGTQPDDGIFKFKEAYAPAGVLPSRIGGTIWDPQAYGRLKEDLACAGVSISANRFQFYDIT